VVKQVPHAGAERALSAGDKTVERSSANNGINETLDGLHPSVRGDELCWIYSPNRSH
jgi:hypothetical protein